MTRTPWKVWQIHIAITFSRDTSKLHHTNFKRSGWVTFITFINMHVTVQRLHPSHLQQSGYYYYFHGLYTQSPNDKQGQSWHRLSHKVNNLLKWLFLCEPSLTTFWVYFSDLQKKKASEYKWHSSYTQWMPFPLLNPPCLSTVTIRNITQFIIKQHQLEVWWTPITGVILLSYTSCNLCIHVHNILQK